MELDYTTENQPIKPIKPATNMLSNRKSQHWCWCWKSKFKFSHIVAELNAFNKFKFLEFLRIQAT